MGEVQYIWGNPDNPTAQCALSSVVQAMYEKGVLAVGRWVTGDGRDPRMGVMSPALFEKVHCLLWVPVRHQSYFSPIFSQRLEYRCLSPTMSENTHSRLSTN